MILYDVPAEGYEELYGEEQKKKYRAVFKSPPKIKRLLDVGCGTALLLSYLRRISYKGIYVGLDIDLSRLKVASKRKDSLSDFVRGDAHHLPFRKKGFETAVSFTVIHLLQPSTAIRELERVSSKTVILTLLKKRADLSEIIKNNLRRNGELQEIENSGDLKDLIFIFAGGKEY